MPSSIRLPRRKIGQSVFVLCTLAALIALSSCATAPEPEGPTRKETVLAVTNDHQLIRFNAGQPRRILDRKPLLGLPAGDALVGIDFRVARGVLYGLSVQGQLFTIDPASGRLTRIGSAPMAARPAGEDIGFDFNPAADRIRVVSGAFNLRLHPDTAAAVDGDPAQPDLQPDGALVYGSGDAHQGQSPDVVAAAYTYNKQDEKLTTNYALDGKRGTLVMQGSKEGVRPAVSPNTGQLATVGALGLGPLSTAAFDIADLSNAAYAAIRLSATGPTRLYAVNLGTGRADLIGTVDSGAPLRGLAIEP